MVKNNQKHRPETNSWISGLVGGFLYGFAIHAFKTSDQHFWVDEKCNHCQSCEKLCPRGNIKLVDGKPVWNHNCELCFACLQWCPKEAIQYKSESQNAKRSHNPEVTLNDVLLR